MMKPDFDFSLDVNRIGGLYYDGIYYIGEGKPPTPEDLASGKYVRMAGGKLAKLLDKYYKGKVLDANDFFSQEQKILLIGEGDFSFSAQILFSK